MPEKDINPDKYEHSDLLLYKFTSGELIWPLIRCSIISYEKLGEKSFPKNYNNYCNKKREQAINLLRGLIHLKISHKPIQFISSTYLNYKKDNLFFNKIDDYFRLLYSDHSFIYEKCESNFHHRFPRMTNNVSTLFTYIDLMVDICVRFYWPKSFPDLEPFCSQLSQIGYKNKSIKFARKKIIYLNKKISVYRFFYNLFLNITKPKILFINSASYGAPYAILNKEAKKRGIITAEIQHGMINKNHIAYNFSNQLLKDKKINNYLPQYILFSGDYWSQQANTPSTKIVVGNPHINQALSNYNKNNTNTIKNSYLFVSQYDITDQLITLAVDLRKNAYHAIISFRLHPQEMLSKKQLTILGKNNIEISEKIDFYQELQKYENIIGCYSTCLYEALAFKKKVFIMKHKSAKEAGFYQIGSVVSNGDEIIKKNNFHIENKDYWASDFENRYHNFISNLNLIN